MSDFSADDIDIDIEAIENKLYDHFPPIAAIRAVHEGDPSADHLLMEEISAFVDEEPTAYLVGYYRHRVQTWIHLWGYEEFLALILASASDGPIPPDYPADFS